MNSFSVIIKGNKWEAQAICAPFASDGIRFATQAEAKVYGKDFVASWPAVYGEFFVIRRFNQPPNAQLVRGTIAPIPA